MLFDHRMKKYTLLFYLISLSSLVNAQNQRRAQKVPTFNFIENTTDSSTLKFVRTFKCISNEKDDIPSLYRAIIYQATNLGTNCYKVKNFERDSSGTMTLTLDTYIASGEILKMNQANHEKYAVYLFGDDKFNNKEYSVYINGDKNILKSGNYIKYILEQGSRVKINKGGATGSTLKLEWESDKLSQYFSLSGFAFTEGPAGNSNLSLGMTTGQLNIIDADLGRLLAAILNRQE